MLASLLHWVGMADGWTGEAAASWLPWLRTTCVTTGVAMGALCAFRSLLRSRRGRCMNDASMAGRTCLITGANSGIGRSTAMELARRKARVILACRDTVSGERAASDIRARVPNADVRMMYLDLASFECIREFAFQVSRDERVDVLVCNAAIYGAPFQQSADGIEKQFAVNHLGHFLLTDLLLPSLQRSTDPRVVVVSSLLYKQVSSARDSSKPCDWLNQNSEYLPGQAYARSKLANILFANELARRVPSGSMSVNSLSPGMARTQLGRYRERSLNFVLRLIFVPIFKLISYFLIRSADEAAETVVHLCTDPSLKGCHGNFYRECKMADLLPGARDEQLQRQLWEVSERACGISGTAFSAGDC